ncbi:Uncharacterised protein family UPF0313, C-terminal [Candidatus Methylopumilus planktonicus]
MEAIEKELNEVIHEQEIKFNYEFKGKKVEFEASMKEAHKKLKIGLIRWLSTRPQNLITGPIIYSMIFPMLILDLCISFYQLTCFPIYKIKLVKRSNYISFDRHHLQRMSRSDLIGDSKKHLIPARQPLSENHSRRMHQFARNKIPAPKIFKRAR